MINADNYKDFCEDYIKLSNEDKKVIDILYNVLTKTLKGYKRNLIEEMLFMDTLIQITKDN